MERSFREKNCKSELRSMHNSQSHSFIEDVESDSRWAQLFALLRSLQCLAAQQILSQRAAGLRLSRVFLSSLLVLLLATPHWSHASGSDEYCPDIHRITDVNCDGILKMVFLGDSIVKGVQDSFFDELGNGGYPLRLSAQLPMADIWNLGIPGATTRSLFRATRKNSRRSRGRTFKALRDADIIVIDVGRNDFWERVSEMTSLRNIKRLKVLLTRWQQNRTGKESYIVVSSLIPTKRPEQQIFVDKLNSAINRRKAQLNVYMRFEKLGTEILSEDNLHPNALGYDAIAEFARRVLARNISRKAKALQPQ